MPVLLNRVQSSVLIKQEYGSLQGQLAPKVGRCCPRCLLSLGRKLVGWHGMGSGGGLLCVCVRVACACVCVWLE